VLVGLASLVNAAIIAVLARRLLGAPVGWPRTIALALLVNAAAAPLLTWAQVPLGLPRYPGTGDTAPAQVALVTSLIAAWLIVAEVVTLAILEAFAPTGSLPDPWVLLRGLPARVRRTRRYLQILRIAAKHGLGRYLRNRPSTDVDPPASATARALRLALTEAGVTFVKLGQTLSTRADILPEAYVRELSSLHSDVPPQPWPVVRATLEAELGGPVEDTFEAFDEQPLAAASVGQVHAARLHGGDDVVVKVQRSDARAQVTADLDIVLRLSSWLDRRTTWARRVGLRELGAGFAEALEEELDFTVELANVQAVAATRPAGSAVRIPRVHPGRSTRRVLVMERLPGLPLSTAQPVLGALGGQRRHELAATLLSTVLSQIVVGGVFHADLHAGNVLIDEDGRLGLLDFGSVGRLDRNARQAVGLLLIAVDRQDSGAATMALLDLLDRGVVLDHRALERDVGGLLMRFGGGVTAGDSGRMLVGMLRLVIRHGLSVPPHVAAAFRALGSLDGTLQTLSPGVDLIALAREQGRDLLSRGGAAGVRQQVEDQLLTLLPLVGRLPRRFDKITEDLEAGRLTVTMRALQHPSERDFLTGLAQQVVVAVLASGTALGGVLMVTSEAGPMMTDKLPLYTFLGFVLLLFGFVLGSRAVVLVFRHRPPDPSDRR
jgi:ubiquinone biosynthesis protein